MREKEGCKGNERKAQRRGKEKISKRRERERGGDHDPESGGGACAGGSGTLFVVPLPPRVSVNYELPMVKVLG